MNLDIIYGTTVALGTPGTPSKNQVSQSAGNLKTYNIKKLNPSGHQGHQGHQKNKKIGEKPFPVAVYPDCRGWKLAELQAWKRCLECEWAWWTQGVHACILQNDRRVDEAMRTCTLEDADE